MSAGFYIGRWVGKLKRYGLTAETFEDKLAAQKYACAICKLDLVCHGTGREINRSSIDHCHETGKTRGILCGKCNTGIAFFGDDATVMRRAAKYVEKWRKEA